MATQCNQCIRRANGKPAGACSCEPDRTRGQRPQGREVEGYGTPVVLTKYNGARYGAFEFEAEPDLYEANDEGWEVLHLDPKVPVVVGFVDRLGPEDYHPVNIDGDQILSCPVSTLSSAVAVLATLAQLRQIPKGERVDA